MPFTFLPFFSTAHGSWRRKLISYWNAPRAWSFRVLISMGIILIVRFYVCFSGSLVGMMAIMMVFVMFRVTMNNCSVVAPLQKGRSTLCKRCAPPPLWQPHSVGLLWTKKDKMAKKFCLPEDTLHLLKKQAKMYICYIHTLILQQIDVDELREKDFFRVRLIHRVETQRRRRSGRSQMFPRRWSCRRIDCRSTNYIVAMLKISSVGTNAISSLRNKCMKAVHAFVRQIRTFVARRFWFMHTK